MMDIKKSLDEKTVKKIFSSRSNAKKYLERLSRLNKDSLLNNKFNKKGSWEKAIVDSWDYKNGLKIIREMFKETEKYKNGKNAESLYQELIKRWDTSKLGPIKWPCSQGQFEALVQEINNQNGLDDREKDKKVELAAVQYRRMKELNTARNDFMETEIFERNPEILPTLAHRRGTDYFIEGEAFDQKVAASPTTQFQKKYGENWREQAKTHPEEVAKYLYEYQSEERFGSEPRLLIVYLDQDVSLEKTKAALNDLDFSKPIELEFDFKHKAGIKKYKTKCFVILLSNS